MKQFSDATGKFWIKFGREVWTKNASLHIGSDSIQLFPLFLKTAKKKREEIRKCQLELEFKRVKYLLSQRKFQQQHSFIHNFNILLRFIIFYSLLALKIKRLE